MHVGLLGTMAQMFLKDLAEKTRRGQLGRALKGRSPGGKAAPAVMHPNLSTIYRRKVEELEQTLNDPAVRADAAGILRGHIDRLEVLPGAARDGEAQIILHGDLARILTFCAAAEAGAGKSPSQTKPGNDKRPAAEATGRQVSVVAGARNRFFVCSRIQR
jgi:hypothetical protein